MFICKAQNIFLCSQNAPPFLYKYSPFKAFLRPFLFRLASHRAILRLLSSDRSSHFTPFPPFLFFIIPFLVHPKDWSFSSTIGCYSATSCQLAVESFFFLRKSRPHLIFCCWFSGSKNLIFLRLVLFFEKSALFYFEKSALILGWICISPRKSSL